MHIEYFDYFYQVAKIKSISKVAKQIHISQSALSQQLQKLEDSLGYKLLERSNKGVILTEMGEIVLKYSENLTNIYNKMLLELDHGSDESNSVLMEACPSISNYALPCSLYKMKEKFPSHKYQLITNVSRNIKSNVINDISDIGFVYGKSNESALSYYEIGKNKFVLTSSYYYDVPKSIDLEDLFKYPLISMTIQDEVRDKIDVLLKSNGYSYDDLKVLFILDTIEAVKSSLHKNYGLAFLPYIAIKEELYHKQFKIINVDKFNVDMDVYMIGKKNSPKSKAVQDFIDYFKIIGEKSFC
ncbi:MAG: LysR family transcriptional regulator [Tissierellales bacterium]|nr:LysR family transcriptional regulator [Tissierellales bacterium]MBN2826717.1 LysR family transcriptional regulator [Tissierellales bacterium]